MLQSGVFEREMAGAHVLGRHECRSVPLPDNPAAIKGASAFPQNAGYNPTLTVGALAYWAAVSICLILL
jgi:hypothetical protein